MLLRPVPGDTHACIARRPGPPDSSRRRLGAARHPARELRARSRRHDRRRAPRRIHCAENRGRRWRSLDVQHQSHVRERPNILARHSAELRPGILEPDDRFAGAGAYRASRGFLVPEPPARRARRRVGAVVRPQVTPWQLAAFAYAILARMAYVLFVGSVLRRQERGGSGFTHREFRWRAALVMNHDAFAFIVCCVVTRDTWALPVSWPVSFTVGAVLADGERH